MAEGILDIGTLAGTIEMDDRLTSTLELVTRKVESFAEDFLDHFKGITFGVGLAVTAITGMAATITTLAVKGSEINDIREGFDRLSGGVENAEEIMKAMRTGVVGLVNDLDLMRDANRLLSAGVKANAEDFQTLTTAAHVLANQGYGSIESVLGTLNRAMITGSTFRIKQLGVSIDATKAERDYASSLGIATTQLTREQNVEAVRIATLAALNAKVKEAGEIHLSFAERFDALFVSVRNWVHEFESMVAASSHVNAALDAVTQAIRESFGSEGQSLLQLFVGWINTFADVVTTYAPPIIRLFGQIKDTIKVLWDTIDAAWDSLPDWLKTVVKDAALTAGALYLTEKALDALLSKVAGAKGLATLGAGGGGGGIGIEGVASMATIASGSIDTIKAVGSLRERFVGLGTTISGLRATVNTFGESMGFAMSFAALKSQQAAGTLSLFRNSTVMTGVATGGLVAQLTTGAVVIGSAIAVYAAASEAIGLYHDRQEQAAAATRQSAVDQTNIARISALTGKEYHNIADAVADANKYIREHAEAWDKTAASQARAMAIAEAHKKSVDSIVSALVAQSTHINETADVFARLTTTQKLNRAVQDELIKRMEDQMAQNIRLNDSEKEYYEAITRSRAGDVAATAARVNNTETIKAQADGLRALGLTEEEVAGRMGLTIDKLHESEKPLLDRIAALEREGLSEAAINERLGINADVRQRVTDTIKRQQEAQDSLIQSTDNYNMALSHGSFDSWKKNQDDMMDIELRNLRQSKEWTQDKENAIQTKYRQTTAVKRMQDEEAIAGSRASGIKERDDAKNKLDLMMSDISGFHTEDILAAREDYNDKARSAEHWSSQASEAEKVAAKAAEEASAARQEALKKEQAAQDEWASHWTQVTLTINRETAKQLLETTGGGMWAEWSRKFAQAAIEQLDAAQLKQNMAVYATRDALVDLADQAKKTYDAMLASGKYTAEALQQAWQKYTQAQEAAFGRTKQTADQIAEELAASAGFKTRDELKKLAEQAKRTYDFMLASGRYTAEALTDAWKKYTDAQNEALGVTAAPTPDSAGGAVRRPSGVGFGFRTIGDSVTRFTSAPRPGQTARSGAEGPAAIAQTNIFNVNGTDEQSVRRMSEIVMKRLRVSNMLPSRG